MRNSRHTEYGHCGHEHHHPHHHRGEHEHESGHYYSMHGRGPRGVDERDGMGYGGPGGPGGRGRGERPERVFGRGDLPLIVLALIELSPRHGYEIIKAIEERCGGAYAPSPGAVYPTLTLLEEQDYVTAAESASGKKLYTITELGRTYIAENRVQIDGILARLDMFARIQAKQSAPERVREAMHTLKHALMLNKANWTVAEAERVAAVLEQAANQIIDGH